MTKKIISFALALVLIFSGITAFAQETIRIQGEDRYQTAAALSDASYTRANTVMIANGSNYIDALAASTLANILNAPILLTTATDIPEATRTEILKLGASEAIILGGENTIEPVVEDKIKALGLQVSRIGGQNRYETSELIYGEIKTHGDISKVIVTSSVADAVSSSGYRGDDIALILVDVSNPSEKLVSIPEEKVVLGGVNSVSDEVYAAIGASDRIGGSNRFETSVMLAKLNTELRGAKNAVLVNAFEFVDAFTVSSYVYVNNLNVLLTHSEYNEEFVKAYLSENEVDVALIGGTISIVDDILDAEKPVPEPEPEPEPGPKPEPDPNPTPEPDPKPNPIPEPEPNPIDPSKPMIAITYDDGPNWGSTERILNVLKAHNAKATFFVLGDRVASREAILQRQVAEGHEIGNHSYGHPDLTSISYAAIQWQIANTQDVVYKATGVLPKIARPTYGAFSQTVKEAVTLPLINWSVDTRDWESRNANSVYNIILNNVKDGDIVLMHDIHEPTATASEMVIPELVKRGYQLVTVSELFAHKGMNPVPGYVYYHAR